MSCHFTESCLFFESHNRQCFQSQITVHLKYRFTFPTTTLTRSWKPFQSGVGMYVHSRLSHRVLIFVAASVLVAFVILMASAISEFLASPPSGCGKTRTLLSNSVGFPNEEEAKKQAGQGTTLLHKGTKFCVAFDAESGAESIFVLSGPKSGIYLWIAGTTRSAQN